jgi:hypothetical protein
MRWLFLVFCIAPGLSAAATACIPVFEDFLSRFEANRPFQEENIIFPLKHSFVDAATDPEPKVIDKPLSKSEVMKRVTTVFPSQKEQKRVPFEKVIKSPEPERMSVRLQKPDTGYQLIYHFEKRRGCWKLVEFEDPSI